MSVGFINHEGCRILLIDFERLKETSAILAQIAAARGFVARLPKRKELLTLVDLTRIRFDSSVLSAFRDLNQHDEPWERAVAVCGLYGVGAIVFRAQNLLTGNRLRGFGGREEALAWLVGEELKSRPKP
jgi:hypothetical protein